MPKSAGRSRERSRSRCRRRRGDCPNRTNAAIRPDDRRPALSMQRGILRPGGGLPPSNHRHVVKPSPRQLPAAILRMHRRDSGYRNVRRESSEPLSTTDECGNRRRVTAPGRSHEPWESDRSGPPRGWPVRGLMVRGGCRGCLDVMRPACYFCSVVRGLVGERRGGAISWKRRTWRELVAAQLAPER